ncbi:MAG: alpha/beta fold hydrolase [Synechococcus sp. ELA057]
MHQAPVHHDVKPSVPSSPSRAAGADPDAAALWQWCGHRIAWTRAGSGDSKDVALLIHGFGASLAHWRHTIPALSGQAEVLALDLLGFGASDKPRSQLADEPPEPGSVRYCFDLWAQQVIDFLAWRGLAQGRRVHLIGNSVGAVVALLAASKLQQSEQPPAQVVLIDCAQRTLDRKRLSEQPPAQRALRPLLMGVVRQRWLLAPLFRFLARPAFIRQVLSQAYPSGANVDEQLVTLLHRPSIEAGALESFRGFVNLFDDHLAPDLLAQLTLPVRMLWGERDPWEDPAEARRWAATYPCIRELVVLEGLGHCPHDEAPERVNPILQRWLRQ